MDLLNSPLFVAVKQIKFPTSILSTFLAQPTTLMPCWTSARATAAPIPTEAPVTRATLPFHRSICLVLPVRTTPNSGSRVLLLSAWITLSQDPSYVFASSRGMRQPPEPCTFQDSSGYDAWARIHEPWMRYEALCCDCSVRITSHSGADCGVMSPPSGQNQNTFLRFIVHLFQQININYYFTTEITINTHN